MKIVEIIMIAGALTGMERVAFYGYAEVVKANAWKRWAERCDPNGSFGGPPERNRSDRRSSTSS
jgi:hypothetical protein